MQTQAGSHSFQCHPFPSPTSHSTPSGPHLQLSFSLTQGGRLPSTSKGLGLLELQIPLNHGIYFVPSLSFTGVSQALFLPLAGVGLLGEPSLYLPQGGAQSRRMRNASGLTPMPLLTLFTVSHVPSPLLAYLTPPCKGCNNPPFLVGGREVPFIRGLLCLGNW